MKTVIALLMMVSAVLVQAAEPARSAPGVVQIQGRYVIDVRTQEEWESGHIEGAVHIPYDQIDSHIAEVTTDKAAHIGLYCQSGGRAAAALATLKSKGYTNVENLGGMATARKTLDISP
jgi:phage shock protein E